MDTMKAVIKEAPGPGHVVLTELPIPTPKPGEVLIRIKACAVCGTDMHIYHWNDWAAKRVKPPAILGHEFAGIVVDVGAGANRVKVGDKVTAETHLVCGACEMCRSGHRHVCFNTTTIGVSSAGAFAEYITVPEDNVFVFDEEFPLEVMSLLEPFGAGVHAVMAFPVALKSVAVIGCGAIGSMSIAAAKAAGARVVIGIEPNPEHAKLALEMGASAIIDPLKGDVIEAVRSLTDGMGVDIALDFSGNVNAIRPAISYLKPEGKMAALGLPEKDLSFNIAEFVYRGLTLKGIAGRRMYETWTQALALIRKGVDISRVITHEMPLENFEEAFRLMDNGECCKVLLTM